MICGWKLVSGYSLPSFVSSSNLWWPNPLSILPECGPCWSGEGLQPSWQHSSRGAMATCQERELWVPAYSSTRKFATTALGRWSKHCCGMLHPPCIWWVPGAWQHDCLNPQAAAWQCNPNTWLGWYKSYAELGMSFEVPQDTSLLREGVRSVHRHVLASPPPQGDRWVVLAYIG